MRMDDVPLFPLNTVLFPQMVLPLVIFEQRYRLMISECLKNNTPFGVLLLREGDEVQEGKAESLPPRPYQVGTLARITEVAKRPDGSMVLTTIGTERFRLLEFRTEKPYMTGDIEIWPDGQDQAEDPALPFAINRVRDAFTEYLQILMELAGKHIQGLEIPTEGEVLSYLVPNWLHVSMEDKQKLLETPDPLTRLQTEYDILQVEIQFFKKIQDQATGLSLLETEEPASDEQTSQSLSPNFGYDLSARFSKN